MDALLSLMGALAAADDDNSDKVSDISSGVSDTSNQNDAAAEEANDANNNNPLDAYGLWSPKPREDCAICMRPLPIDDQEVVYYGCCGKKMCAGCRQAARLILHENNEKRKEKGQPKLTELCAYCREPTPIGEAAMIRHWEARMELNDGAAYFQMGNAYLNGFSGRPKMPRKGFDLLLRSAELGCPEGCLRVAACYQLGENGVVPGVAKDPVAARRYYELAAKGGSLFARHQLGVLELKSELENKTLVNTLRAIRHWKIAAENGYKDSLDGVVEMKDLGIVSKEECNETARAYYEACEALKSEDRDRFTALSKLEEQYAKWQGEEEAKQEKKTTSKVNSSKKGGKGGKKKGGKKKNRK